MANMSLSDGGSDVMPHGLVTRQEDGVVAQWRSGTNGTVALPTKNREAARRHEMAPDASIEYPKKTNNRWPFVRYAELFIKIQITDMSYDQLWHLDQL